MTGLLPLIQEAGYGQDLRREAQAGQCATIPLVRADAVKAAKRLTAILGRDTDIFADEHSNTIFVRASADKIKKAKEILQRLDAPSHC